MPSLSIEREIRSRVLLIVLALAGAYMLIRAIPLFELSSLVGSVLFFVAASVAFVRGIDALYLVIFAMLFSPEIGSGLATGKMTGEGALVVIRLEDVVLVAVALGWMLRSAYRGRRFGIVKTPVNNAIWLYVAACIIATLLGVIGGDVRPKSGFFHNVKYFEYFFLFFMILAHVRGRKMGMRMISAMLIVFFLTMMYAYTQMGRGARVCAPFDAEPNTFGGYIVLMMCVATGIALEVKRTNIRIAMILLLLFSVPPLFATLSRASYLALIAAFFAFLIVSRQRQLIATIAVAFLAAMIVGLPLLPEVVQERITGTFQQGTQYHVQIAGIDLDPSASARVISYGEAVETWAEHPFFGHGITGAQFIDGQYFRILVESGVFGLGAFLWIFLRLSTHVIKVFHQTGDTFFRGTAMGFFCGILAMLTHAIGANSFVIVRIAEPFWLIAGLVLLIPQFEEEERARIDMHSESLPDIDVSPGDISVSPIAES